MRIHQRPRTPRPPNGARDGLPAHRPVLRARKRGHSAEPRRRDVSRRLEGEPRRGAPEARRREGHRVHRERTRAAPEAHPGAGCRRHAPHARGGRQAVQHLVKYV